MMIISFLKISEHKSCWGHLLKANPAFLGSCFSMIARWYIVNCNWTNRCRRMFSFVSRQSTEKMSYIFGNKRHLRFWGTNCTWLNVKDAFCVTRLFEIWIRSSQLHVGLLCKHVFEIVQFVVDASPVLHFCSIHMRGLVPENNRTSPAFGFWACLEKNYQYGLVQETVH